MEWPEKVLLSRRDHCRRVSGVVESELRCTFSIDRAIGPMVKQRDRSGAGQRSYRQNRDDGHASTGGAHSADLILANVQNDFRVSRRRITVTGGVIAQL